MYPIDIKHPASEASLEELTPLQTIVLRELHIRLMVIAAQSGMPVADAQTFGMAQCRRAALLIKDLTELIEIEIAEKALLWLAEYREQRTRIN